MLDGTCQFGLVGMASRHMKWVAVCIEILRNKDGEAGAAWF